MQKTTCICDRCEQTVPNLIDIGTWDDFKIVNIVSVESKSCKCELCERCFLDLKKWLGIKEELKNVKPD